MKQHLKALEERITTLAADKNFIHHQWFVEHHLKIVEQLALELCDLYPAADRSVVQAMVWLHDLGKILTSKKLPRTEENLLTQKKGREILQDISFDSAFIENVIANLTVFESMMARDLRKENIEIQIASSADGCSHFIGPFFSLYWYENAGLTVEELVNATLRKTQKDWEHKIVLPEARAVFKNRIEEALEYNPAGRKKNFMVS